MEEIEVGEYIRTNQGIIGKIKRIELDKTDKSLKWYVFDKKRPDMNIIDEIYINKPYIVKHSKNIINLIECGDFVNGHKVKAIYLNGATKYIKLDNAYKDGQGTRTYKENIETILTKESYMANCYKVGGEDE